MPSTIKLSKESQHRLREHGKMGDSFEDVVNRMLDDVEENDDELDDEENDI